MTIRCRFRRIPYVRFSSSRLGHRKRFFLLATASPRTQDELKTGTLIGEDKLGNKYYENNYYFYGRNRWVVYADRVWMDYDGSQVPAEWFGWLHYKTDLPPFKDPNRPHHKWMMDHTPNVSGTKEAYMPYSTTRPKVEPWKPT